MIRRREGVVAISAIVRGSGFAGQDHVDGGVYERDEEDTLDDEGDLIVSNFGEVRS